MEQDELIAFICKVVKHMCNKTYKSCSKLKNDGENTQKQLELLKLKFQYEMTKAPPPWHVWRTLSPFLFQFSSDHQNKLQILFVVKFPNYFTSFLSQRHVFHSFSCLVFLFTTFHYINSVVHHHSFQIHTFHSSNFTIKPKNKKLFTTFTHILLSTFQIQFLIPRWWNLRKDTIINLIWLLVMIIQFQLILLLVQEHTNQGILHLHLLNLINIVLNIHLLRRIEKLQIKMPQS